jgi:plasmid stabilization system protein ParE
MGEGSSGGLSIYVLTPTARRDLKSIWQYIAKDSLRYANLVEDAILETCRSATKVPALGHRRAEIEDPRVLFLAVSGYERYSIAYLANSEPLRVLRVVHGARDVPRLFRS